MQNEEFITKSGKCFVRVNKIRARKLYNEGHTIWMVPDMMRLDNAWQSPCSVSKGTDERSFDTRVNEFCYYNCDSERGRGVKYFVHQNLLINAN